MQALTRHELLAVLRAPRENNRRDFCLILIAYSHGCRATEAAKLKLANLNIRDWTLRIERLKHSKTTVQTILPNAERLLDERKAINEWLAHRSNLGPYLFSKPNGGALSRVQVYRLFRSYAEAAGLPEAKRGQHAPKHALAQHMVTNGKMWPAYKPPSATQALRARFAISASAHSKRTKRGPRRSWPD